LLHCSFGPRKRANDYITDIEVMGNNPVAVTKGCAPDYTEWQEAINEGFELCREEFGEGMISYSPAISSRSFVGA
jgi:hypothetical protein